MNKTKCSRPKDRELIQIDFRPMSIEHKRLFDQLAEAAKKVDPKRLAKCLIGSQSHE